MKSHELRKEEIEELKQRYYYDNQEESQLYYDFWEDIPDKVIIEWYSGFYFVEEDFFCNM